MAKKRKTKSNKKAKHNKNQNRYGKNAAAENKQSVSAEIKPASEPERTWSPAPKSTVKKAGIKSISRFGNSVVVSTFDRGAEAKPEKLVRGKNVSDIQKKSPLEMDVLKRKYRIKSKSRAESKDSVVEVLADKPRMNSSNTAPELKTALETALFGKDFNDNVRVQIAYAVADITKYLARAVTEVVYCINVMNRGRSLSGEAEDFLGTKVNYKTDDVNDSVNKFITYSKWQLTNHYDVFFTKEEENINNNNGNKGKNKNVNKGKNKKVVYKMKSDSEIYNILRLVSMLRNCIVHPEDNELLFKKNYSEYEKLSDTLGEVYSAATEKRKEDFIRQQLRNTEILSAVTGLKEKEILQKMFDFEVTHRLRIMGFNLTKLREYAIEEGKIDFGNKTEEELNKDRARLYRLIDFAATLYLIDDAEKKDDADQNGNADKNDDADKKDNADKKYYADILVDMLRMSKSEEEKEKIYRVYARRIFSEPELARTVSEIIKKVRENKHDKEFKLSDKISVQSLKGLGNVTDFSKLVFLISRFMDGKRANELITSLISKFQDIDSFNKLLRELPQLEVVRKNTEQSDSIVPHKYIPKYALFEMSGKVAQELSQLRSIAIMKLPAAKTFVDKNSKSINAEKMLIYDALATLGVEDLKTEYNNMNYSLKNIFRNNIIKDRRFLYVCKYINPADVKKITSNKVIVNFVLSRMDDSIIEKYYTRVSNKNETDRNERVKHLSQKIGKIKYDNIKKLAEKQKQGKKPCGNTDAEHTIQTLRLYYTVAYLFVKQMTLINSNYVMAINALESDIVLYNKFIYDDKLNTKISDQYNEKEYTNMACLTRAIVGEELIELYYSPDDVEVRIKKEEAWEKQKDVCKINKDAVFDVLKLIPRKEKIKEYNDYYRKYRNAIVHLNVVSYIGQFVEEIKHIHSYFEAYHFILQSALLKKNEKIKNLLNTPHYKNSKVDGSNENCIYSRRLLRVLNIPFFYNLPRYRNLSFEKFFLRWERKNEKK